MLERPNTLTALDPVAGTDKTGSVSTKAAMVKEKQCPYCGHPFTSSSLGRHLDQYLFKKRPDGIHNVEEIQRLRGGITRRTARRSVGTKHDRERSEAIYDPSKTVRPTSPITAFDRLNVAPADGVGTVSDTPNWRSTGVINDIPVSTKTPRMSAVTVSTCVDDRETLISIDVSERGSISPCTGFDTETDTVRALELSLQEVVHSLQAARCVSQT